MFVIQYRIVAATQENVFNVRSIHQIVTAIKKMFVI